MRKRIAGLLALAALLSFVSCRPKASESGNPSSDSVSGSSEEVSSASSFSPVSSASSSSSSETSSSENTAPLPEGWAGIVRIYYRNDSGSYTDRAVWVWETGGEGAEYPFENIDSPDDYGIYKDIDLTASPYLGRVILSLNFIVKFTGTWNGQSQDINVVFQDYASTLEKVNGKDRISVYCTDNGSGTIETFTSKKAALGDTIRIAAFTDFRTIHIQGTGVQDERTAEEVGLISHYRLYALPPSFFALDKYAKQGQKSKYLLQDENPAKNDFTVTLDQDIDFTLTYYLEAYFPNVATGYKYRYVSFNKLYDTEKFNTSFTYDGKDLGLTYDNEENPTFKVWSPSASLIQLRLYESGTPTNLAIPGKEGNDTFKALSMIKGEKGVWSLTPSADALVGKGFYTYEVYVEGKENETIDPYAYAGGINGARTALLKPSDLAKTDPDGFRAALTALDTEAPIRNAADLTVYEVHVRDFTADSSWVSNHGNARGTFAAFSEEGTTYTENSTTVTTGFDSLKELGVNAIQLLPVFDQANDERTYTQTSDGTEKKIAPKYNWGYNPQNYDLVEGAYSSDPFSSVTRIGEFKGLIGKAAENGIRVIMDVVYNHMNTINDNAFSKTMPGYFFKYDETGAAIDETGVHNTFNTTRKMASRYVVDSTAFWAKEYGIKGFRFDLMGALETSTMRAVKDRLYEIDPKIVVYGEGWRGSGSSGDTQAGTYQVYRDLTDQGKGSVGCFNDCGRNGLKGDTAYGSTSPSYGFISQGPGDLNPDTIYNAACVYLGENRNITGNAVPQKTRPEQTVNYVSCHDNYTLYDQLNYCYDAGNLADTDQNSEVREAALATESFVLMSQGIAFFQGGEEIFRQKIMKPDNPFWDKADSGDYVTLTGGNRLIRNSYAYGDEVNSFKWNRKIAFRAEFAKFREAIQTRKTLIQDGILGADYDTVIQGTFDDNGTTRKVTRLWDDIISQGTDKKYRPILAAQTQFSKLSASGKDIYVFLGGRMSGTSAVIGCGSGTLKVLYSNQRDSGTLITVSDDTLTVGRYEMLIVEREA
jgi:type I pullulanase